MKNDTTQDLYCEIIDEMPYQLQIRDAIWKGIVVKNSTEIRQLPIRPSTRGEYIFDGVHLFFHRKVMPMFIWQVTNQESTVCKVYPSVIQMQKIEFLITNKTAHHTGIRKIRSIGDDDEFEHLRNYIPGNNIKHINWKASSRRNELVVNQYQDNRSQNIYLLIDKGRCMEMPFDLTGAAYTIQRFCQGLGQHFSVRAYTEPELTKALGDVLPKLQGCHYHDIADPAWFGLIDFKVLLLENPGGIPQPTFTEQKSGLRWYSQR